MSLRSSWGGGGAGGHSRFPKNEIPVLELHNTNKATKFDLRVFQGKVLFLNIFYISVLQEKQKL